MTNKREFFRKLKKNRLLVLAISVIIITGVYYGVEKAIDSYDFNTNSDIIKTESENDSELLEEATESTSGEVPEDEVNLELEEVVEETETFIEEEIGDSESVLEEKIYVYVTGEVNIPGVVILNKGDRIVDAINSAGGTTAKADISKVNLVYILEDGMKVNIPNSSDLKNNHDFEYITMNSGDGASDNESSRDSVENSSSSNLDSGSNYSLVNINTATQTELETLPGIGPSLALKIINYRKENGKFTSIEDVKNVSGIGDRKFDDLKQYITI